MDGNIINAFLTLSLIVVAFGVLLFILKRSNFKKNSSSELIEMKVISKMALNQKNQLYIVQIGNKRLLLGVSDAGVRNLSDLAFANNADIPVKPNEKLPQSNQTDNLSFRTFLKSTFSSHAN